MADKNLRRRQFVDYSALHSRDKIKKSPKISDDSGNLSLVKSPSQHEKNLHADIAQ